MNITVSIIVPTLNSEKTILRTIYSVIKQKYKNWEIVIIDGGSKDATLKRIRNIKNNKINIFHASKSSLSAARYFGIKKSRGKYISFLDSDDEWMPNKLSRQMEKLELNSNYFSCTDFSIINDKNKSYRVCTKKNILELSDIIYHRPICLSSVLIKKTIALKYLKNINYTDFAEDWLWWLVLLKNNVKCIVVKKNLVKVHLHQANRSHKIIKNYLSIFKIYRNFLNFNFYKISVSFLLLGYNTFRKNLFKFKSFYC